LLAGSTGMLERNVLVNVIPLVHNGRGILDLIFYFLV
jgi:hypothetical protein